MIKRLKPAVIIEVLLHLLFWAFITVLPILSRPYENAAFRLIFPFWHLILINVLLAVQFYLNAFLLIPVVLNKNKNIWLYFALLLLAFISLDLIIIHTRPVMQFPRLRAMYGLPPRPPFFANFNLLPLTAITAAGFAYRYLADQFRVINNKREITNAALVSELAFLRSQISPHFIFNVINSVVALSRLNPVAVEPTLIQLSKLLRYMLYITDEEKVTMQQKTDYLGSYIELQRLRFRDQVTVNFNFDVTEPEKTIEPMLLIPFVENAFKYGTGDVTAPVIDISLKANNKLLDFKVQNTYNPNEPYKDENHGIGLNNVKRRLELLYPNKHSLLITQADNIYKVNLQIQLK
ncbi:sensor histidine kinase [Mucilaginibacter sp.]|uniref:sensor histidine kinase n=1 Tax=Mucilaginibacter sp. TaxID=1882438 RepID=UPI003D0EF8DE